MGIDTEDCKPKQSQHRIPRHTSDAKGRSAEPEGPQKMCETNVHLAEAADSLSVLPLRCLVADAMCAAVMAEPTVL